MIANTPKQNVPERPPVRRARRSKFTAFELAIITSIASTNHPTDVQVPPGQRETGEGQVGRGVDPIDRQHREHRGDQELTGELAALVESEVAGVANADVVV